MGLIRTYNCWYRDTTAIIDEDVIIGAGTKVWHFSHICAGARIGKNCTLGQNVYVGPGVHIGDNCKIQNNVSVYEGVTLENNVFVGPSVVFTNTKYPKIGVQPEFLPTVVKSGAAIGANATIVCGATIGEDALIGAGAVVTKDVKPGDRVVGNPAHQITLTNKERVYEYVD